MVELTLRVSGGEVPVKIGAGLLDRLGSLVREAAPGVKAVLAMDGNVAEPHGARARASLEGAGYEVAPVEIEPGEASKTLETVRWMYARMLEAGADRGTVMVALGGGVVGDAAGFAAATFMRGVALVQVPTTLLAMVDASIGGKTGVNFPLPRAEGRTGGVGKNLIGAFWQPRLVVSDPAVLRTLPRRHVRCGLAECVKHAVLSDPSLLGELRGAREAIERVDVERLGALVARSAATKIRVVSSDEREAGARATLNLGHTFAHAIEPRPELGLEHGEAVSIGLAAAFACAEATGFAAKGAGAEVVATLEELGLPTRVPRGKAGAAAGLDAAGLIEAMRFDKKSSGGRLRLILPRAVGRVEIVEDVEEEAVREAWRAVGVGWGGAGEGGSR